VASGSSQAEGISLRNTGQWLPAALESCTGQAPTEGELARVDYLVGEARRKLRGYRWTNKVMFVPGMLLLLLGVAWPAVALAAPGLNAEGKGSTLQSICFTAGGICFVLYLQYKSRQRRMEDAIRKTVCVEEEIGEKIARLIRVTDAMDTGMQLPSLRGPGSGEGPPLAKG